MNSHSNNDKDIVFNHDPFVQHNINFRNDLNSKPVQISVNINNTINFNYSDQSSKENGRHSNRIEMDMDMTDSSDKQEDDDDDDDDKEEENDDNDETTSDEDNTVEIHAANFPTPPTSDYNEDDNHH